MSSEGLLIALVLFAASAAWVVFPLLRQDDKILSPAQLLLKKQHDKLTTRYSQVLSAIQDMDEDHLTGKINSDNYESERQIWAQRGVEVLKQLDQLEKSSPGLKSKIRREPQKAATVDNIDDAIESAVSDYIDKSN